MIAQLFAHSVHTIKILSKIDKFFIVPCLSLTLQVADLSSAKFKWQLDVVPNQILWAEEAVESTLIKMQMWLLITNNSFQAKSNQMSIIKYVSAHLLNSGRHEKLFFTALGRILLTNVDIHYRCRSQNDSSMQKGSQNLDIRCYQNREIN